MNKFYQIPTDLFVPVSHDNSYLFNHYERIANFLAFNLEKNYKSILAKPVQNGYEFDWFSVHDNLININEKLKGESQLGLIEYWAFLEKINAKINQLSSSSDENNKNWASLLSKVFNHKDNFIFSNGKEICIVWGWKFDNNENSKANISKTPNTFLNPDRNAVTEESLLNREEIKKEVASEIIEPFLKQEDTTDQILEDESIQVDLEHIKTHEDYIEKSSFLNFLKWFASNFWWLLLVLASLIILVFLYKTVTYSN
jgi:hypothetical protein